jgi:hypothetical protein
VTGHGGAKQKARAASSAGYILDQKKPANKGLLEFAGLAATETATETIQSAAANS